MKQAFVVITSEHTVDTRAKSSIVTLADGIISSTFTVVTKQLIGEAVMVAGKMVTSLFLVRNELQVKVIPARSKPLWAVVARRDEQNNLAELRPVMMDNERKSMPGALSLKDGSAGAVGNPLLMPNVSTGAPEVTVALMSYRIQMTSRREDEWNILSKQPNGSLGGGIWDLEGRFVGITLAARKSFYSSEDPKMLSLGAKEVMDFAESN